MTRTQRGNLRFAEQVSAGSTSSLEHEVREPSTIERLIIRIYPGAELDLRVKPYVEIGGDGPKVPLLTYEGKEYVDGDDDKWEFDLVESVDPGDKVGVEVTNVNSNYAYDYAAHISLDPGADRSLLSVFGGVL